MGILWYVACYTVGGRRRYVRIYNVYPMYADVHRCVYTSRKGVDVCLTSQHPLTIDLVYTYITNHGIKPHLPNLCKIQRYQTSFFNKIFGIEQNIYADAWLSKQTFVYL